MIINNTNRLQSIYDSVKDMPDVDTEKYLADYKHTTLEELNQDICDNVYIIRDHIFYEYRKLKHIDFPNAISIGTSAFDNCESLVSVNCPNVTSIGNWAFDYCKSLVSVNCPNVTSIGTSAFANCTSLTSIDFPNAISIGASAFRYCESLVSVNCPNVTSIGYSAFEGCTSLESIDLPLVTYIGDYDHTNYGAFKDCTSLTTLILRANTLCTLTTYALNNTPIANGTGYIYIPRALIEDYKVATPTYANQFRALEDYTIDGTATGELDLDKI